MEKTQTGMATGFFRIELNDHGDYVTVPTGNDAFFDSFSRECKQLWAMAGRICSRLKKIERERKKLKDTDQDLEKIRETAEINIQFSRNATGIIDSIFGEGTVKKYFRKFYEEDPGFMPDVECFTDFLEQITPVMKRLSGDRLS